MSRLGTRRCDTRSILVHEPEDLPSRLMLREQQHRAIDANFDVTNSTDALEQGFGVHDAIALENHAVELSGLQCADDQVALPFFECGAIVEGETRYGR